MTENEKIKVLLLGDVTKILNDKAGTKESELCLLLCSSKEFETFTHRDIFDVFTTPQIKMLPAEPLLDDLRDLFKENIEAIEKEYLFKYKHIWNYGNRRQISRIC